MAPALVVSDYDAWHFASAYRTTSLIGSSAAQVKPVHLLSTPPHKSKSLMHIHSAPVSMKEMTDSDGRVTDGCYRADPTAVAIWVLPVPLCGVSTLHNPVFHSFGHLVSIDGATWHQHLNGQDFHGFGCVDTLTESFCCRTVSCSRGAHSSDFH